MALTANRFYALSGDDLDPLIECGFFASLKMRNGTFKLTRPGRFAALEDQLAPILRERIAHIRQVLDVGASIGVTTAELADFLRRLGASPEVVGTDLFVDAHLVEAAPALRVLCDAEGWPLQYDVAGYPVRAWIRRLDYLTLLAWPRLAARSLLRPRLKAAVAAKRAVPVRMATRALARQGVELVENDIFEPSESFLQRFDFVRAANVLNLGYFPPDRIAAGIVNIRRYCRGAGALLFVLRSDAGTHDGTLFELGGDGRFHVLHRIGKGSEIEGLVLSTVA